MSITAHCCIMADNTPCSKNNRMRKAVYQASLYHILGPSPLGHVESTTTLIYLHPTVSLHLNTLLELRINPSNPIHQTKSLETTAAMCIDIHYLYSCGCPIALYPFKTQCMIAEYTRRDCWHSPLTVRRKHPVFGLERCSGCSAKIPRTSCDEIQKPASPNPEP